LSKTGSPTLTPGEVIRATKEEKEAQIKTRDMLHKRNANDGPAALKKVQDAALKNENLFEALMEATKVSSLGQITNALFEVGGQYRRNM
ncbi:MAG TPA: hypothetical protein VJ894_05595, partial [Cryomorphaceae bacterium]|nr:hypothetical protein [Cryomorphaceae bacterium]